MKSSAVRKDGMTRRYEPHVAAINRLIEELRAEASVRFIDARYGEVDSRMLFLF